MIRVGGAVVWETGIVGVEKISKEGPRLRGGWRGKLAEERGEMQGGGAVGVEEKCWMSGIMRHGS